MFNFGKSPIFFVGAIIFIQFFEFVIRFFLSGWISFEDLLAFSWKQTCFFFGDFWRGKKPWYCKMLTWDGMVCSQAWQLLTQQSEIFHSSIEILLGSECNSSSKGIERWTDIVLPWTKQSYHHLLVTILPFTTNSSIFYSRLVLQFGIEIGSLDLNVRWWKYESPMHLDEARQEGDR